MSFVRVGRSQQGKRPVRPKKSGAPKREWVGTVNDLSVHKLTPEELYHRHEIHKSHNKAVAQWELKEKALQRHFKRPMTPSRLNSASQSIIREVFSDQLLLRDVLARSDRAMAVVKDLFGDAPRRQTGHPTVTMAPGCDSDSVLPVVQRPDPPTQLSLLSQSTMDQQALNELEGSEEDYSEEDTQRITRSNVMHGTNLRKMAPARGPQRRRGQPSSVRQGAGNTVPVTPCTSGRAPDPAALNATVAVRRLRSQRNQSEEDKDDILVPQVLNQDSTLNHSERPAGHSPRTWKGRRECVCQGSRLDGSTLSSLAGNQSSLGLLHTMLGQVKADLDFLGPWESETSSPGPQPHPAQSLTGFSVALVSMLGRLVQLHKEREEEAQKEAKDRSKLEEEVSEQRALIDALTAEMLTLREESAALQAGLHQRTAELEQKVDTLVLALGGLGAHWDSDVIATDCQPIVAQQTPEPTPAPVAPAVLLSPPQQRDSCQHRPVVRHVPPPEDIPPPHSCRSRDNNFPSPSSPSVLSSLSCASSPGLTDGPLCSRLSQEAMLDQITQLTQQNQLIRAQLTQARGLSGAGSPNRGTGQCSSGRSTPQSGGEGRSTGRGAQQGSGGEQFTQQLAVQDVPSVSSVEQRLLELNRQSAAARTRLLELIEQQKQSATATVSPSASPIPPSAFSPHPAEGRMTPEASMLLSAQDSLSQASGSERRSAGSDVSSLSFGGETRNHKMHTTQNVGEGWFALSTHMR